MVNATTKKLKRILRLLSDEKEYRITQIKDECVMSIGLCKDALIFLESIGMIKITKPTNITYYQIKPHIMQKIGMYTKANPKKAVEAAYESF